LTGLIIAVALVQPTKKLENVTLESIKKKWNDKTFAKGVNRAHAELAPDNLGIPLDEFISLNLKALQGISSELGL
jgi:predicted hydrolase (HD superfamily)